MSVSGETVGIYWTSTGKTAVQVLLCPLASELCQENSRRNSSNDDKNRIRDDRSCSEPGTATQLLWTIAKSLLVLHTTRKYDQEFSGSLPHSTRLVQYFLGRGGRKPSSYRSQLSA